MTTPPTEKRTVTGSCHCKYIKYEVQLPIDFKSFRKCNCTICQKPGFIPIQLPTSGSDFTLLTPPSPSAVKRYVATNPECARYFCDRCGVQVWGEGTVTFNGQRYPFFIFNLSTVDQPQEGIELSTLTVGYLDGLGEDFAGGEREGPWPGGIV